jgi:hypothetical protein
MDRECYNILSQIKLSNVRLIALEEFEVSDKELLAAKENRTLIEYYFTRTPSLLLFIFDASPEVGCVIYLDADLFFFGNPEPIFEEIGDYSVAIVSYRFPPHLSLPLYPELSRAGVVHIAVLVRKHS